MCFAIASSSLLHWDVFLFFSLSFSSLSSLFGKFMIFFLSSFSRLVGSNTNNSGCCVKLTTLSKEGNCLVVGFSETHKKSPKLRLMYCRLYPRYMFFRKLWLSLALNTVFRRLKGSWCMLSKALEMSFPSCRNVALDICSRFHFSSGCKSDICSTLAVCR